MYRSGDVSSSTIDSSRIIQLEDTLKSLLARVDSLQADLDKEKAEKEFLNKRLELTETALVSLVEDFRTQSATLGVRLSFFFSSLSADR
jgi:predicted  nucleic acid-binding Zn-ribbon protein